MDNRRTFLKKSIAGTAGISMGLSAKSYARVPGANDRINVGVMGTRSRGAAVAQNFLDAPNTLISHICDVDERILSRTVANFWIKQGEKPKANQDIRKIIEDKDLDVLLIAAPDHWHAPAAIMALQAGKHVYVEKPCGHNPREGELLVEAQKKYGKVVQMGNQQRSGIPTLEAIKDIKNGSIGEPYFAKAWYANTRGPIGNGKEVAPPNWLNYELWQGPAPRKAYQDNLIHYNWHWFWHWGTGEICNNGTHEIDVCRWALGVDYPVKVSSNGGRYHFDDDWQFYDTQVANFDFQGGKTITWEGRSCNGFLIEERGRGATIHGTKGTMLLDRNIYILYDNEHNKIKEVTTDTVSATMDTTGAGDLTQNHVENFLQAIRAGTKQNSPIAEGHKSTLLCHLGNIAQETGKTLQIDPGNGHIQNDPEAMKMWSRKYENGWELKV